MIRTALAILALTAATAQAEELTKRAELGRADTVSDTQTETIITELRMMPGAYVPVHTHPGDEHIYIVTGGPLTTKEGKTIPFKTGGYIFFPRGQVHGGLTAAGDAEIVAVTVHVVDKGKPVYEMLE